MRACRYINLYIYIIYQVLIITLRACRYINLYIYIPGINYHIIIYTPSTHYTHIRSPYVAVRTHLYRMILLPSTIVYCFLYGVYIPGSKIIIHTFNCCECNLPQHTQQHGLRPYIITYDTYTAAVYCCVRQASLFRAADAVQV